MAVASDSTTAPGVHRALLSLAADAALADTRATVGRLTDAATAAVFSTLPVPLVFRLTPPVDDPRSADELLDEIRLTIEGQVSAQTEQKPEVPPDPLLGGHAPHGVAPLPSLPSAFSRRAALFGAVTATGFLAAAAPRFVAVASAGAGSADARLEAILDELNGIEAACNAHAVVHRDRETDATQAEFDALADRFSPLEEEMADLPADTLAGVLAKVRALDIPTCAACESGIADSVCDDIRRLHATGRLA